MTANCEIELSARLEIARRLAELAAKALLDANALSRVAEKFAKGDGPLGRQVGPLRKYARDPERFRVGDVRAIVSTYEQAAGPKYVEISRRNRRGRQVNKLRRLAYHAAKENNENRSTFEA